MISKKQKLILTVIFLLTVSPSLFSYEIFIYRPFLNKLSLSQTGKIFLHGELFAHLQLPSTFPSFNDMTGKTDRWTFGFQNIIHFTPTTVFLGQLVTHDDGGKRTKFDWHFSLRQYVLDNLVLIAGHDSNHDSENQSYLNGKRFYLNRNYIGFGIPFFIGDLYLEPFTWIMHHTNQPANLDYSGEILKQEFGLRAGWLYNKQISFHFQILAQTDKLFSSGISYLSDLIVRIKAADFLEISLGGRIWRDLIESRLGNKQTYYKLMWGVVIPF